MQKRTARRRVQGFVARFLSVVLILSVCLLPSGAVTQQEINDLKSQAAELNSQKAQLQSQIDKLSSSKSSAMEQKQLLEQKINILREEIAVSEKTIANLDQQIQVKEQELAAAKEEEAKYYDLFCQRVRSMEEDGEVSYWAVLFQVSSFSQFLDQMNKIGEIMDYDNMVMDQLEAARIAVAQAKSELEAGKAEEEAARNSLRAQKSDLDSELAKVDALIAQINSQSAAYASQMEDVDNNASSIDSQLRRAEKAYAAQLDAQKRAEQARQQQQAQAAAAARQAAAAAAAAASATKNNTATTTTSTTPVTSSGSWSWPLSGYTHIASPYGYRICPFHGRELHRGCDITAPGGTPIMAARSGVVLVSTYDSSYGNYVTIAHSDGTRSLYAHMSSRAISAGSTVSQGQVIGYVGSTGTSTANHLHFEIWTGSSSNSCVNPLSYF